MRIVPALPRSRAAAVALVALLGAAQAQTKITIGKIIGGIGLHIPSYVAMDQGFFKDEGLDAQLDRVAAARPLITAGLTGNRRFRSDPVRRRAGGAERRRAPLRRRPVAEVAMAYRRRGRRSPRPRTSRARPSATAAPARPTTTRARPCCARFFKHGGRPGLQGDLVPGRARADRGAGQRRHRGRADFGAARAAGACSAGMKIAAAHRRLHPAGRRHVLDDRRSMSTKNPDTVKKFIRAIAKGVMYFRDNKAGSLASLKEHLGVAERRGGRDGLGADRTTRSAPNSEGAVPRDLRVAPARP